MAIPDLLSTGPSDWLPPTHAHARTCDGRQIFRPDDAGSLVVAAETQETVHDFNFPYQLGRVRTGRIAGMKIETR